MQKDSQKKIKPLYYLKEKEILAYAFLKNFNVPFTECPYARFSFRSKIRDFINNEEKKTPGVKENIIKQFLKIKKTNDEEIKTEICNNCGFPSDGKTCRACRMKEEIKN